MSKVQWKGNCADVIDAKDLENDFVQGPILKSSFGECFTSELS